MRKRDFLRSLALLSTAWPLCLLGSRSAAAASAAPDDKLVGLWEMVVAGSQGSYRYLYSISRGSWIATGNIDENYQGYKYSPSMGAYTANGNGSYRYKERGWVFDRAGTNVGTFESAGSFRLDEIGKTFAGPGTYTQFDAKGKKLFVERFTASAQRLWL